ncbi:unnamed protein product [Sphagnum tenellum]
MTVYMKMKYSNYLVLFFDHWIHSIAFYQTKKWERTTCESIVGEDDHFSLPEGVEPLFWTSPYNTPSTAAGLASHGLHYNKLQSLKEATSTQCSHCKSNMR